MSDGTGRIISIHAGFDVGDLCPDQSNDELRKRMHVGHLLAGGCR